MSRTGAALVLLGTFVLGMLAGAALLQIVRLSVAPPFAGFRRGPPHPPEPPVEHMTRELKLTPDQVVRLRGVLDESRKQMRATADATRDRIRGLLTDEQRAKFDTMRPPPPPPGFGPPPPGFPPPPAGEGPPPGGEGPPPPGPEGPPPDSGR